MSAASKPVKSAKRLLDELVDAIQDFDAYYGRSGREDEEYRRLEKAYKSARHVVHRQMTGTKQRDKA